MQNNLIEKILFKEQSLYCYEIYDLMKKLDVDKLTQDAIKLDNSNEYLDWLEYVKKGN